MLEALKKAGIPATICGRGYDEFIGRTANGKIFHIHRAYNAYGEKYTLEIEGMNKCAVCTVDTVINKIKEQVKRPPRGKITIKVNLTNGGTVLAGARTFKDAIVLAGTLKGSHSVESVNIMEVIKNEL